MPYLTKDIRLYVNPSVILGREGEEVRVISQKGHVLIVQDVAKMSSPYSITTSFISNDKGKDNINNAGIKAIPPEKQRSSAKGSKRRAASSKEAPAAVESLSLFG